MGLAHYDREIVGRFIDLRHDEDLLADQNYCDSNYDAPESFASAGRSLKAHDRMLDILKECGRP